MNDGALLCINTGTGRATRYVRMGLLGMRIRAAESVDVLNYNAYKPIAAETITALENFRKDGTLG